MWLISINVGKCFIQGIMVTWLVEWSIDWLVVCLIDSLVNWLIWYFLGMFHCFLSGLLWMYKQMFIQGICCWLDWVIGSVINWLISWMPDWFIGWLIDLGLLGHVWQLFCLDYVRVKTWAQSGYMPDDDFDVIFGVDD